MEKLGSMFPASLEPRPLRISVIVPVRDGGYALGECLTALRASDFPAGD